MKLKVQEVEMHWERFERYKIPLLLLLAIIQPTPWPYDFFFFFLNIKVKKDLTEIKIHDSPQNQPTKKPKQL